MTALGDKRNYGVDLLRMVSMFMVLILHILGAGGILGAAEQGSANYQIAWLLETAAYGAVNCYALISGFVGAGGKHRYANIAVLWLQVVLYSVGIHLIFMIAGFSPWDGTALLRAFFPVLNNYGWYFTCYFALFFFMPLLNHAVSTMKERDLKALCLAVFLLFSLLGAASKSDIFQLHDGYSVLWLGALYLLGGCIRRFGWLRKIRSWKAGLLFGGSVLTAWGWKWIMEIWDAPWLKQITYSEVLIRYKAPTVLIASIALLLLFANLKIPGWAKHVIRFLSPAAFGVYILHMHPQIWNRLIVGRFASLGDNAPWVTVLAVLGFALVFYLAFSLIDLLRHHAFRLLKIKEIFTSAEIKIRNGKN